MSKIPSPRFRTSRTQVSRSLDELLADPACVRLDHEEDRIMSLLRDELCSPGSTGSPDRDFAAELQEIKAEKAALEVNHD